MNSSQHSELHALMQAHPDHKLTEKSTPVEVVLRCSCQRFKRSFTRRQNALGRVAKMNAARREHLQSLNTQKESTHNGETY